MIPWSKATPWEAAYTALRARRPRHALRLWWRMRYWNDNHFPGCPKAYNRPGECLGELCDWINGRGVYDD